MFHCPVHRRPPRAGIDPINSYDAAFMTVSLAVHRPLRHETIVVMLDHERRGLAITAVSGTEQPDDVIEVVECLTSPGVHQGRLGAVIVASVRAGADADATDIDRWLEMSDIAEAHAVELLEWIVIGRHVECPRDRLGEPPRW